MKLIINTGTYTVQIQCSYEQNMHAFAQHSLVASYDRHSTKLFTDIFYVNANGTMSNRLRGPTFKYFNHWRIV